MMHVCTMHIYMLLDHYAYVNDEACIYDSMMHACVMHVKNGDGRMNGQKAKF